MHLRRRPAMCSKRGRIHQPKGDRAVGTGSSQDDEPLALRRQAAARQAGGAFEAAQGLLRRAVELAPLEAAGWTQLADCLLQARRPEAALAVCDLGLQRLPARPALLCAKARALQSLSRVAEAGALYRQALALDAASAEARIGLA